LPEFFWVACFFVNISTVTKFKMIKAFGNFYIEKLRYFVNKNTKAFFDKELCSEKAFKRWRLQINFL